MVQVITTGHGTGIIIIQGLIPGDSTCIIHHGPAGHLDLIFMVVGLMEGIMGTMAGITGVADGGDQPATGHHIVARLIATMAITATVATSSG